MGNSYDLTDRQMESNTSNRIWIGILATLVVILAVIVGVFIWRETIRKEDNKAYTEENIRKWFPGYFRNAEEQMKFKSEYFAGFENPTPVTKLVPAKKRCIFQCFNQTLEVRKRRSRSGIAYHGCCESFVDFVTPGEYPNQSSTNRTIVQFGSYKQYFLKHSCSATSPCSGCRCAQEYSIHTAVVIKAGVTSPDDIDDIEIDFFKLDGCCRCVNT